MSLQSHSPPDYMCINSKVRNWNNETGFSAGDPFNDAPSVCLFPDDNRNHEHKSHIRTFHQIIIISIGLDIRIQWCESEMRILHIN